MIPFNPEEIKTDKKYGVKHFEKDGETITQMPTEIFAKLINNLEDLKDLEAIRRAKKEPGEYFPQTFVIALCEAKTLGARIRLYREYRGLTQQQLADKATISRAYTAEIEMGKKTPSVKTLCLISDALGCTLDDIV